VEVQFWSFHLLELGTEKWTTARCNRFIPGEIAVNYLYKRFTGPNVWVAQADEYRTSLPSEIEHSLFVLPFRAVLTEMLGSGHKFCFHLRVQSVLCHNDHALTHALALLHSLVLKFCKSQLQEPVKSWY
jgi:hypothetical protein